MYQVRSIEGISEISAKDWNHLCGQDYPFLRHEFLHALEASSAVSPSTGWTPCHLLMNEGRQLIAVMPMYIKTHSYGEYVFDWAWADAWQRYGLPYYPKLLTAIPFTPATGPRIGTHHPLNKIVPLFIEAIQALGESFNTSGWHGLFTEPELTQIGKDQGLFTRLGTQYHWFNRQYSDFEHYLAHMTSRKRKSIRKERDKISKLNLRIRCLEGHEIDSTALNHFYQFYQITHLKRGRKGYLNRAFLNKSSKNYPNSLCCAVSKEARKSSQAPSFLKARRPYLDATGALQKRSMACTSRPAIIKESSTQYDMGCSASILGLKESTKLHAALSPLTLGHCTGWRRQGFSQR
ncbi:hypothetical protein D791_01595 [Nitrincola nitratireducens]|uniref:FemAB-related protein, PEP-CTERM system-associated n=1 Tax=Nitrincola nitratireducens TaxID=1229521 RepID=W9UW47_9GAMM|nr:hypothetical protein D791_01595 [Nitrincola nitratireducens]